MGEGSKMSCAKEFAFWLPMNKDMFGFKNINDAPLNIFQQLKSHNIFEKTLYEIITYKKDLKDFRFYIDQNNNRVISFKKDNISIVIFSNGLYLINFKEKIDTTCFIEEIDQIFGISYLRDKLFTNSSNSKEDFINLEKYEGILTYTQIEILLNGLYDENIAPSFYFDTNEEIQEKIKDILKIDNIFKSIVLYKKQDKYLPLKGLRKIYNVEDQEDLFLSTMEQFIRVANTFSLEHYKRGLDFCLKQLSRLGAMRSFNQSETTKNFLPPSLTKLNSSLASLESYQTLIFEKLPIIEYLHKLSSGLIQTVPNKNKTLAIKEALRQYKRRIFVINRYFKNVEDSIAIENQKNIQYELSEIRKYNEINMETVNDNIINKLNNRDKEFEEYKLNKLLFFITFLAATFTIIAPIVSVIITSDPSTSSNKNKPMHILDILSRLNSSDISILIGIILFLIFIGILIINFDKIIKKRNKNDNNKNDKYIYSRHIFENTYPYNEQNIESKFNQYIDNLRKGLNDNKLNTIQKIPSIIDPNKQIKCIKLDSFQEKFPMFKIYKFSFYSQEEKGIKYILHIDIEFDFHRRKTSILDIRIVIFRDQNSSISLKTIHDNAKKVKDKFRDIFSKIDKSNDEE